MNNIHIYSVKLYATTRYPKGFNLFFVTSCQLILINFFTALVYPRPSLTKRFTSTLPKETSIFAIRHGNGASILGTITLTAAYWTFRSFNQFHIISRFQLTSRSFHCIGSLYFLFIVISGRYIIRTRNIGRYIISISRLQSTE